MATVTELAALEEFKKISTTSGLCVVNFWASWAEPCKQVKDVILELAKDPCLSGVNFVNVEAEKFPEISQSHYVIAVPTCVLLKRGIEVDRINGVYPAELANKVKQHKSPSSKRESPQREDISKDELNKRLRTLIKSYPVMVFMKGSPNNVKCGFSKKMVEVLRSQKVNFGSFDILTDETVRQGLKEYSNWPTFPQLYADGEFIGGIDIVRAMVESGDFISALPSEAISIEDKSEPVRASAGKDLPLNERLKQLTHMNDVMVFMKGVPTEPRCGFSRHVVSILNESKVSYGHFNILADDEVRQGLKEYSNWPTYPQVYAKGELIGGLDIIKELQESGELENALKGSK